MAPDQTPTTDHRALLAAALDPSRPLDDLDPFALAELFKDPAVRGAIQARARLRALRLHERLAAATERAIGVLTGLFDSSKDPTELRRAATASCTFHLVCDRGDAPGLAPRWLTIAINPDTS